MDLQLALLLIGAVIIGIVVLTAYDKGRLARSFHRGLSTMQRRARESRREPVLPPDFGAAPPTESDSRFLRTDSAVPLDALPETVAPDPIVHALEDIEEIANRPLNLNPGFDPPGTGPAGADIGTQPIAGDTIDFIVHLPGPGPVSRRSVLSIYKQNEYKLEYPRQLYGQRYQTNYWSVVQHDSEATQYSNLKLAIQLTDARGPINESELNTFSQIGLKLADSLHRPAKFSTPFEQALERARALQKFCDEYDVIAGVNVMTEPHVPFKGPAIVAAMERVGMPLDASNMFHRTIEGRRLYSLSNLYKPGRFNPEEWDTFRTAGVTLFMVVPTVPEPAAVFDRMIETAKELTAFLAGKLLDQEQRPLTDKGIAAIRLQIQGIDANMRAFGIVPGSEAAVRLFGAGAM